MESFHLLPLLCRPADSYPESYEFQTALLRSASAPTRFVSSGSTVSAVSRCQKPLKV